MILSLFTFKVTEHEPGWGGVIHSKNYRNLFPIQRPAPWHTPTLTLPHPHTHAHTSSSPHGLRDAEMHFSRKLLACLKFKVD